MKLFKAELWKYLHEVRTYYPDHIVSVVVTTIVFYMFLLVQYQQMNQGYVGFVYWYLLYCTPKVRHEKSNFWGVFL